MTTLDQQITAIRNARLHFATELMTMNHSMKSRDYLIDEILALADAERYFIELKTREVYEIEARKLDGYRPCGRRNK